MSTVMLGSQVCVEQAGMLSWSFYMLNGNHSPTHAAITSLRGRRGERRRFVAPQSRHQSKNAVNHVPKTVRPRRWLQPHGGRRRLRATSAAPRSGTDIWRTNHFVAVAIIRETRHSPSASRLIQRGPAPGMLWPERPPGYGPPKSPARQGRPFREALQSPVSYRSVLTRIRADGMVPHMAQFGRPPTLSRRRCWDVYNIAVGTSR